MEDLCGSVLILTENALCGIKAWQVATATETVYFFHICLFVIPPSVIFILADEGGGEISELLFPSIIHSNLLRLQKGTYFCSSNDVQCLNITCFHLSPHFFPSQQFVYMTNREIVSQATKLSTDLIRYRFKDVATGVWFRENKCLNNNLQNSSAECPICFKGWCIFTGSFVSPPLLTIK